MVGRNLWLAITFGFLNAGEAVFTAWLIGRWFGGAFKLDNVQQVLGFMVASAAGSAIAAVGAAAALSLTRLTQSPLDVWRVWFAACFLGAVTIAPLLIGLGEAVRTRPPNRELAEGALGLIILAALSAFVISLPEGPWESALPVALVFIVLLWVTVRCRPAFAAAAATVVAFAIIWSTTASIGHFGDANVPVSDRTLAAQTYALAATLLALVLAALFADRRRSEAELTESRERLQLALDGAELGVWSVDTSTGRFENDARDSRIHGHHQAPPKTLQEARAFIHADDLRSLDAAFMASMRTGGSCKAEYRLTAVSGHRQGHQQRWVAVEGTVVRNAKGRPVRLLGITREITERKRAEEKLQKSERALREILGALPAAIYTTDAHGRLTYCNQGAVDLWGARPKLGIDRWCDLGRFYHVDGTPMQLDECPTEIALKEGRCIRGYEAILERADGTRVPIIPNPTPLRDVRGAVVGVVNMTVDISERQQAEETLAERNALLALAGQAALVGSYAYESDLESMKISEGYCTMHGLPEGTTETTRTLWRARVHPDDLGPMEELRARTFRDQRRAYNADYRIVCPSGEVHWIEARSIISYHSDGKPQRIIGINIDVTKRKHTETLLRESEARYRALYDDNPSMYFTVDAEGTVLSVNQFGAQALGYTDAELVGRTVLKIVHEEDREAAQQQLAQCTRNPSTTVKGEIRKVRRDGSVLWVRETSRAVQAPDGRTVILIVCEDTTERKQAENLLKESKTRLSDALAAGLVVAFEWDARTGRSRRSDNANRIMGFAEGGDFLQQVHSDDRENFRTHMRGLSPANPSYALSFRFIRPDGRQAWLEETARGEFDSAGRLLRINGLTRDITERKELEDHKNMLISELDHRVKNVLATVLTVASRTQETSSSMAEFVAALEGRIKSMAITHELLSYRRWQGIPLAELVRHELAPYATTNNARVDGPDVVLSAEASQALAMVFHELATNAAKFGALSVRSGIVSVHWNFRRNGHAESWLRIQWQESGGPDVVQPTRSGFGTSVVRELIPYELAGTAALMHLREGVRCKLEIPARWLSSNVPEEQSRII
jgi:PAS domain S-box-containing protein